MESLAVSTDVFVPPERVYEFLVDFPGYARYSEYLDRVERDGDGAPGTVYHITVAWWRLSHTVRSEVTDVDPPSRIDWRLLGPIAAAGAWEIDERAPADVVAPVSPPADLEAAARVSLVVRYDPSTLDGGHLDLPAFLSLDGLVDRLAPLVEDEARATVERIVADLEGEQRPVELAVETGSRAADVENQ